MLEPQSTLFFVLLVVVFIGLLWWMLVTSHLVLRILAALLAFTSAMTFGIATVNKYYDYYPTWGSAWSDLTSQGVPATSVLITGGPHTTSASLGHFDLAIARQYGLTLHLRIRGRVSRITRSVYVFLPPQYFKPGYYQNYHFPVIELLHGFPGQPQDWITVLGVNTILDTLISEHKADPAVLVMPDANGGRGISLQCLNQHHGSQDDTYLAKDLPDYIYHHLRVQPLGAGWGIAGYSEGGFCAANLGLQHGSIFNDAGVLSGYFRPDLNQLINPPRRVSAFASKKQERADTPVDLLRSLPLGRPIPQFWLGAGDGDAPDVHAAQRFSELLQLRQPSVTLRLVPNSGHTMLTWRLLLPPMLQWMTRGLAAEDAYYNSAPAIARRHAAELAKERRAHEHMAGQKKTGKKKKTGKRKPPGQTATKHKTPARA
ncbi:MAG: alpha/beta hydrolase [Streptosporangiaceae bacterium]